MEHNRCWIEVSRKACIHNIEAMRNYLPAETKMLAIVKANSYGHDASLLPKVMEEAGISDFGVACVDEAVVLRESGIKGTILILEYVDRKDWQRAIDYDCIMSVSSVQHGKDLNDWAAEKGMKIRCEVKVDTGMRRIGLNAECPDSDIISVYGSSNIIINGTYSHFCCADSFAENDIEFTGVQNRRFASFIQRVRDLGFDPGRTHLSASSGFINYPEYKYDFVRPGFTLYGYNVGDVKDKISIQQVLSMRAKVEYVKDVEAGEGISYGRLYYTEGKRRIATVAAGYADGYRRSLTGKSYVLIHGQKARVVGRICMDQMMIDVTDIPDVKTEDVVTLIGTDGNETISIEQISAWADTIGSDYVTTIPTSRVKRYLVD
ncbi:MAG: alanine racemase [Erysipelotrichaceae bacterium]|nr:alanine racemase [Erysipelotrichaceae bacterium]